MPNALEHDSSARSSKLRSSTGIAALALFCAVNLWVGANSAFSREKALDPHASDTLAVAKFCRNQPKGADIALLGSSLVEVASVQSAALAAKKPVDRLRHRYCEYFDQALRTNLGLAANTVNLALGGAMASDAYLLTKHLLHDRMQPRAIVYGISPRDFQDNLMFGVETSEAFKLFYAFDDLPDVWGLPGVTPETKLALSFSAISPLWENRSAISNDLAKAIFAKSSAPSQSARQVDTKTAKVPVDGPLAPGESVWHPTSERMKAAYRIRYNPMSARQIRTQLSYFQRLLALCAQRHVPILVVNMPIGADNQALMPPKLYDYYLAETQKLCQENNAEFQDLNKHPLNDSGNFLETVHLNPQGSVAFFDELAKSIGSSTIAFKNSHFASTNKAPNM